MFYLLWFKARTHAGGENSLVILKTAIFERPFVTNTILYSCRHVK